MNSHKRRKTLLKKSPKCFRVLPNGTVALLHIRLIILISWGLTWLSQGCSGCVLHATQGKRGQCLRATAPFSWVFPLLSQTYMHHFAGTGRVSQKRRWWQKPAATATTTAHLTQFPTFVGSMMPTEHGWKVC